MVYNVNMMEVSDLINKQTGLKFSISDSVILRTGREAKRAYLKLGNMKLAVMLIEVPESFNLKNEIRDLIQLAEYERVIIYTSHLLQDQMKALKESRIGYIDDHGHFYFPLDVVSSESYQSEEKREVARSSSTLNEFPIGFLFFKNSGLLDLTQAEIGELIGKSPATVNLVLKRMEKEGLIVKIEYGYHLANLETYFDRWRFIVSQFKTKKEFARYKTNLSDNQLREFLFDKLLEGKWALSGPRIESLLDDGYLEHAEEFSIFIEAKSQKGLMKDLKLIPSSKGEVTLYPSFIDLRDKGQFAHEIVICAELFNSNNPRIREAGERRFEKYLAHAKKVMNERFGNKYF